MYKILQLAKFYPPDRGGIECVTQCIHEYLNRSPIFSSEVVCFSKPHSKYTIDNSIHRCRVLFVLKSQPFSLTYLLRSISFALKADIIHLHLPNYLSILSLFFLPSNKKIVVHWHSDVVDKGVFGKVLSKFDNYALSRSARIIVTSRPYLDYSCTLKPFREKCDVVPLGVPLPNKFPLVDSVSNRKIILSVGRLVSYKGFDVLINAAKFISDSAEIVIVGSGPLKNYLSSLIHVNGLEEKVSIRSNLDTDELNKLFNQAYLYCMPSNTRAEAFGVVLIEAMSYGLPIVATNIEGSGVPWVNKDGVTGYNVRINSPEEIAKSCNTILNSPSIRNKLSDSANRRFITHFQNSVFCKKINEVFQSIVR